MAVLIYGSHRISEPLAYEVGQTVLRKVQNIRGIENPNFLNSDWILLFDQFCEGIIKGRIKKYQLCNYGDFLRFADEKQQVDGKWIEEVTRKHTGQAVYDLHDRFNPGALDMFGMRELIPNDSPTLKYRPDDGTLTVVQITAAKTDAYPNDIALIEELARNYKLKVTYKKINPEKESGSIEINLPDSLPKYIGVNPENKEDLEQFVENELSKRKEARAIKYRNRLQEALELERLRLISPFSLPDRTCPQYVEISGAVTNFLIEFLRLHL